MKEKNIIYSNYLQNLKNYYFKQVERPVFFKFHKFVQTIYKI